MLLIKENKATNSTYLSKALFKSMLLLKIPNKLRRNLQKLKLNRILSKYSIKSNGRANSTISTSHLRNRLSITMKGIKEKTHNLLQKRLKI
jgi:hypothetical protein